VIGDDGKAALLAETDEIVAVSRLLAANLSSSI